MKLLLHICCAPCSIYPVQVLREGGAELTGFFFNPNIHPVTEYRQRLSALTEYASSIELALIVKDEYLLKEFIREVVFREEERCRYCYRMRLQAAAQAAREQGADAFSTTLLYSIYQRHDEIRKAGEETAAEYGVPFHYQDFRPGWREGVEASRRLTIYRQKYCGCIYSEKERYVKQRAASGRAGEDIRVQGFEGSGVQVKY